MYDMHTRDTSEKSNRELYISMIKQKQKFLIFDREI